MITNNRIILREKSSSDAWDDYSWETDPELVQLDAAPLIHIQYSQYLLDYDRARRRTSTTSRQFAVDTIDGEHIGNCSYYNLAKLSSEVELGIIIGNRDYWDKGYGTDTVTTLVNHIFSQLDINRVYLKTLESNSRAQKCFWKCGFTPYGQMSKNEYQFVLMEIHRDQWQRQCAGTVE